MIQNSIFKLFGRSPISPLEKHMDKANECAKKLLVFFDAVLAGNWEKSEEYQQQIARLEQDADTMKREIRLNLPKGLFMPVSRGDLLELLSAQDGVANRAKDIAGLILGRRMQFPAQIAPQLIEFLKRSIDASAQAAKAISELDDLLESGFRGNEVKVVEGMLRHLDQIETETDEIQKQIRYSLFQIEKDLSPIDVIFLYKIIEWIGDLADRAQHVGGRLHLLLAS
ncbi:MAG: TIGR00153 family protein [Gammaproteobacteria bacterium]|nr:TIGR00153 family protein [Gammaproteobacteria bacterium]